MDIIVLGAGLVGGPMAKDLALEPDFSVSVADMDTTALEKLEGGEIRTLVKDLSKPESVARLVAPYHMVVNAVPGFMGFRTLEAVVGAGKNVVDIAFFPEDPFRLDDLAKDRGVTAVVDCGVAPGMSNVLVGYAHSQLDETRSVVIYVGGLPVIRQWPWEYKAVFSPADVIEEYVRPAYLVEHGRVISRPALSEPELLDFPGVGTLEAFNTDGLRSLAKTLNIPFMKEKTLRYPGHIEKIAVLRDMGFFSQKPVDLNGVAVRPLDLTSRLLFPQWKLEEGEADLTVMKVVVEGKKAGERLRFTYDLLDKYDEETGVHSMARTTGYTATVVARMLARGLFDPKGVCPPEFIGKEAVCKDFLLDGLKARGIDYRETIETIGGA